MPGYLMPEIEQDSPGPKEFACDLTCPTHGPVNPDDVDYDARGGRMVFVHKACNEVCAEDWYF